VGEKNILRQARLTSDRCRISLLLEPYNPRSRATSSSSGASPPCHSSLRYRPAAADTKDEHELTPTSGLTEQTRREIRHRWVRRIGNVYPFCTPADLGPVTGYTIAMKKTAQVVAAAVTKTTRPTTDEHQPGVHLTSKRKGWKKQSKADKSLTFTSDTGKVRVDNLHYELTEDDIIVRTHTNLNQRTTTNTDPGALHTHRPSSLRPPPLRPLRSLPRHSLRHLRRPSRRSRRSSRIRRRQCQRAAHPPHTTIKRNQPPRASRRPRLSL
jgi:hypothetical protein